MPKPSWGGAGAGAVSGAVAGSPFGPIGTAVGGLVGGTAGLFSGQKKEKIKPQSTLRPEQEALYQQAVNAGMGEGAGGAFGTAADYYRNNLSDNPADMQAFAAPELRRFNEDIIPGISEQFAGMGAGGLSSSGFRNAAVGAGTDLSERLGAIRANLRQSSAQGLQNIGQFGLSNFSENVRNTPQSNFGENLMEGIGNVLPSALNSMMNKPNNQSQPSMSGNKVGSNSSPYGSGGGLSASPKPSSANGFNLPNFMGK